MTVITDITELIGNTPLLRLKNFDVPEGVAVYAKLEMMNPGVASKTDWEICCFVTRSIQAR